MLKATVVEKSSFCIFSFSDQIVCRYTWSAALPSLVTFGWASCTGLYGIYTVYNKHYTMSIPRTNVLTIKIQICSPPAQQVLYKPLLAKQWSAADVSPWYTLLGFVVKVHLHIHKAKERDNAWAGEAQTNPDPAPPKPITGAISPSKVHLYKLRGPQGHKGRQESKLRTRKKVCLVQAPPELSRDSLSPKVCLWNPAKWANSERALFELGGEGCGIHYRMQRNSILGLHRTCGTFRGSI